MEIKLAQFKKALLSFEYLVTVQIDPLRAVLDERLIDGIESGKAQKFEYCVELCWKTIRAFLKEIDGIDAKTPKQSVKEYYLAKHITEEDYLSLLAAIDDRNKLSHVYQEEVFQKIIGRFPNYLQIFNNIASVIQEKYQQESEKQ